jgi:hypothetical protein
MALARRLDDKVVYGTANWSARAKDKDLAHYISK